MAVALENLYSRTNWSLGIEGEGFSEGMYCAAPESPTVAEPLTGPATPALPLAG